MRIVHLTEEELRGLLGGRRLSSKRAMEHLLLCDKCQTRLASTAEQSSLVGEMAARPLDPGLADRVIEKVTQTDRRRAIRTSVITVIGALAITAVAVYMVGSDLYARAIQPVWGMMASGLSELAGLLSVSFASIKSLTAGPTI
ncbi:MAG: hypothetical protein HY851_01930, partial [candidate division Zixibacteria bacterium]|nr:hypothetical protein [candidate division Zixibacteria bacterium]